MEMQRLGKEYMSDRAHEVAYFRDVWPVFYGRLFFYTWIYQFELDRLSLVTEEGLALIRREERRVAAFFRKNREFWTYYRSGSGLVDEQFTGQHSRATIYDPLALVILVIDGQNATLGSYRAAWGLAFEMYKTWLGEESERLSSPVEPRDAGNDPLGASDADFEEGL